MSLVLTAEETSAFNNYLEDLKVSTLEKGRKLAIMGRVTSLSRGETPSTFRGLFRDAKQYQVTFTVAAETVIDFCTCPVQVHCIHCAAVAFGLVTFKEKLPKQLEAPVPRVEPITPFKILSAAVVQGLGIKTPSDETSRFITRVDAMFQRAQKEKGLAISALVDLDQNRKRPYFPYFQQIESWPYPPASILDFWHCLDREATQFKIALPSFMQAVAKVSSPSQFLINYWADLDLSEWLAKIESAKKELEESPNFAPDQLSEMDFRFTVSDKGFDAETRLTSTNSWKILKKTQFFQLVTQYNRSPFPIIAEARPVWDALLRNSRFDEGLYEPSNDFTSRITESLASFLSESNSTTQVVKKDSVPFERPEGQLMMKSTLSTTSQGFYRFELTQPNGASLGPILGSIRSQQTWLFTENQIWRSPKLPELFKLNGPTLIPSAAIENDIGLSLLIRMKMEVPERLRERLIEVPLQPVISGRISNPNESVKESLVLDLTGQSPEGHLYCRYWGNLWLDLQQDQPKKHLGKEKEKKLILVHRDALQPIPSHLHRLGVKPFTVANPWTLRITRTFPETFVEWAKSLPPTVRLDLDNDLRSLLEDPISATFGLKLEPAGTDWFDLAVHIDVDGLELSPEELKLLLNARGGYVRLGSKGWRRLEYKMSPEDEEQLARLGLDAKDFSGEKQRLHAIQLADSNATRFLPEREVAAIRVRANEIKAKVSPPIPSEICAELRPYQIEGFHFLAYLSENHFGGVLADDMGLGKTVQTLTWISWLRQRKPTVDATKILIICPKSVAPNWQSEMARFLPKWRVHVWRGDTEVTLKTAIQVGDAIVVNYAQLRRLQPELEAIRWLAVILDEAQAIKNPNSQTAQSARGLTAEHRLALTGTPIENRLLDLWSILSFAMPGVLGTRTQFNRSFGSAEDPLARRRLSARVRPFLLRRTKAQVANDLPDRIEEDLSCEMEGIQQCLYDAEFKKARALLLKVKTKADLDQFRFHFLTSLLRLRQICCHPALVDAAQRNTPSAKLEALFDVLEPLMEEDQKVLIFSQFVTMLDIIQEEIETRKWKTFYLAGDTEDRGKVVADFQSHKGSAVFLISIKAGGFGLNLTAASYVVLFDPWWNPAVEAQAIDRTHRIGQTQKVIAYRLISKGSIEEKIRALQQKKKAVAEDILGEERFSQSLTVDDLRFLFD